MYVTPIDMEVPQRWKRIGMDLQVEKICSEKWSFVNQIYRYLLAGNKTQITVILSYSVEMC